VKIDINPKASGVYSLVKIGIVRKEKTKASTLPDNKVKEFLTKDKLKFPD